MFKHLLIKLSLILILIIVGGIIMFNKTCTDISCLQIQSQNSYKIEEIYDQNQNTFRAIYKNNNDKLRLEVQSNMTAEDATQYIKSKVVKMKSIFENSLSPYPGEIADEIVCPQKYQPVFKTINNNGIEINYFTGFLDDRLQFGACTDAQATHQGNLALFYCPNQKKVYQLELIAPTSAYSANPQYYQSTIESLRCK